jgi:hypothetical protein
MKKQKQIKKPQWEETKVYEVEDIDAITDEIAKTLLSIDPASESFNDAVSKLAEGGPYAKENTDIDILQKIAQKIAGFRRDHDRD